MSFTIPDAKRRKIDDQPSNPSPDNFDLLIALSVQAAALKNLETHSQNRSSNPQNTSYPPSNSNYLPPIVHPVQRFNIPAPVMVLPPLFLFPQQMLSFIPFSAVPFSYHSIAVQRPIPLNSAEERVETHIKQGYGLHDQGRLLEASLELQNGLTIEHTNNALKAILHNNLGFIFKDLKEYNSMIYEWRQGLALEHQDYEITVNLHLNLGTVYKRQGDMNRAILEFQKAFTYQYNDPVLKARLHLNLGLAFKAVGNFVDAIAEFKKGSDLEYENKILKATLQRNLALMCRHN